MKRSTREGLRGPVRWLGLCLVLLGACDDGNSSGGADARSDASGDAADALWAPATCALDPMLPELSLPGGQVKGVLRGTSRNASTTCTRQKGSGGPEALYVLRVTAPIVVELEVTSTIDTVLAIRRTCDDPLSEVACNDDAIAFGNSGQGGAGGSGGGGVPTSPGVPATPPPPLSVDAGASVPPATSTRDARLRTALDPGVYFVLLDEAEPHGVGGAYTLKLTSSAPPAQSRCSGGQPVSDGTRLLSEQLDVAVELPPSCGGATPRNALYYRATIPSGQRFTARATATRGDRAWSPVLQLLGACDATACLGTDRASQGNDAERLLRYVNNGPSEQTVILAVSANAPVSGGLFQLDVSIGEPIQNGTCATARVVSDGQLLLNQDLSEGEISPLSSGCKPTGSPSLFYRATLLPRQSFLATVLPRGGGTIMGRPGVFLLTRDGCNDLQCTGGFSDRAQVTNNTGAPKTVILEISGIPGALPSGNFIFDLKIELPLPPGGVTVTPAAGLTTSEAGASAHFDVVLDSPTTDVVTIPLSSSDPKEGTVSPASLRFDGSNWNQAQRVTVTGANDDLKDGSRVYSVVVGKISSGDARYQGLDPSDVEVTNTDDEPGFTFSVARQVVTSEGAVPVTFTVALNRAPTATVRLPLKSSDEGEGRVTPAELVFEPASWATAQVATVTGVDDTERDGVQSYQILVGPAISGDAQYAGVDPQDLDARNLDNDFVPVESHVVSGALACPFAAQDQRIAADEAGGIYVAMNCLSTGNTGTGGSGAGTGGSGAGGSSGGAVDGGSKPMDPRVPLPPPPLDPGVPSVPSTFAVVSLDGGQTFSAPVRTGVQAFESFVYGLTPGVAVVIGNGPAGVVVTRTETAGATWEAPQVLAAQSGFLRIAAAGKRVVIAYRPEGTTRLFVSGDAGKTFAESKTIMSEQESLMGLGIDGAGAVWMAAFGGGGLVLRKSTDGGTTFGTGMPLTNDFFPDTLAFGPRTVFAAGKETQLLVAPLDQLSQARKVSGLGDLQMFARLLVPDRADGVTVIDAGGSFQGDIVARRLPAGATGFSPAKSLGQTNTVPSGVALGDNALAVATGRNDQVSVTVVTW